VRGVINVPVSCSFKQRVLDLINNELNLVWKEHERAASKEAWRGEFISDEESTKLNEIQELTEEQIETLKGYKNIIEKETCVE